VEEVIPGHLRGALIGLLGAKAGADVGLTENTVTVSADRLKAIPRVETKPLSRVPRRICSLSLMACLAPGRGTQ